MHLLHVVENWEVIQGEKWAKEKDFKPRRGRETQRALKDLASFISLGCRSQRQMESHCQKILVILLSNYKKAATVFFSTVYSNPDSPFSFRGPWGRAAATGLSQGWTKPSVPLGCLDVQLVSWTFLLVVFCSGKMSWICGLKAHVLSTITSESIPGMARPPTYHHFILGSSKVSYWLWTLPVTLPLPYAACIQNDFGKLLLPPRISLSKAVSLGIFDGSINSFILTFSHKSHCQLWPWKCWSLEGRAL